MLGSFAGDTKYVLSKNSRYGIGKLLRIERLPVNQTAGRGGTPSCGE